MTPENPIFGFELKRVSIDLGSPTLGRELLKNAKSSLPIDTWRQYILNHDPHPFRPGCDWSPPSVIGWCDQPHRSTLDPQTAVDDAYRILARLLFISPQPSYEQLVRGIWQAQSILHQAHSSGRKRGQPTSMRTEAVRAYVIREFNPHPKKPGESTVLWAELADKLFRKDGRCPRKISEEPETRICGVTKHQYNSPCVKALRTAVDHLKAAMKHDGIRV